MIHLPDEIRKVPSFKLLTHVSDILQEILLAIIIFAGTKDREN